MRHPLHTYSSQSSGIIAGEVPKLLKPERIDNHKGSVLYSYKLKVFFFVFVSLFVFLFLFFDSMYTIYTRSRQRNLSMEREVQPLAKDLLATYGC